MWTLEIRLFCHRPIVVSTVSRIHCYFFFVFLILVRVWSDINCHENRELLGRLKQSITGPIYWRQKCPLNESATSPNFPFTHALPVQLASLQRCALASCARCHDLKKNSPEVRCLSPLLQHLSAEFRGGWTQCLMWFWLHQILFWKKRYKKQRN